MFSIMGESSAPDSGLTRREWLRVGGLGLGGLTLADLLRSRAPASLGDPQFGRARNVIFLWLQGGPPQHETFDPKPEAAAEIRGEFGSIATNVPGIRIGELLPRTATIADKYAIVRSLVTGSNIHSASGYYVLTGYPYKGPNPRQISPTDWPYFGSLVKMLKPSRRLPAYSTVWLPDVMRLNDNVQPAGQTAGFLGMKWEAEKVVWDPSHPDAQVDKFKLPPDVSKLRLHARESLLQQVDERFEAVHRGKLIEAQDRFTQEAFSVLSTGRALAAFDIEREPQRTQDRYGRSKWGQCVLLARRLVEAGVRLVHVNWVREEGDNAVGNPMWDTHQQNADRLQDVLCPQFDIGFTALIEDLDQRGLLDETLVVAVGEFGRTPKINANAGRDHWGNVSSFVMAGAGIRTAQVIGKSDLIGGHPVADKVTPEELTATIFHLLGIGHDVMFRDRAQRPHHVTRGGPIHKLLGSNPATNRRRRPEGDVALVPSYTAEKLRNMSFEDNVPLQPIGGLHHSKGWQVIPLADGDDTGGLSVRLVESPSHSADGKRHVVLGFGLKTPSAAVAIPQGAKAVLAQEIRNPRSGQYTLSVTACGGGVSRAFYEQVFRKNFSCRLTLFRYSDKSKDIRRSQVLGEDLFQPMFTAGETLRYKRFELSRFLGTQVGNANFSVGNGLGIAITVEKTSPGVLKWSDMSPPPSAFVRVDGVRLDFVGKKRLTNQK